MSSCWACSSPGREWSVAFAFPAEVRRMDHDHQGHVHPPHSSAHSNYGRAFAIGIALNVLYVGGEAVAGVVSGSLALLADAGHNLGDVLGLSLSWGAAVLSRRQPSGRFTYGLRSSSILAALANAIILLVVTGGIAWEAVWRITPPVPVARGIVVWVAAAGVGAAGVVIWLTSWYWLDPAVSLIVSAVIVLGTWGLVRNAINLALDAVPEGVDAAAVRAHLLAMPGVTALHDLHIWGMSTTETALTCHLVMPGGHPGDEALSRI